MANQPTLYYSAHHQSVYKRLHLDIVRLTGADRYDFLQRMSTNDISPLQANEATGRGLQTAIITEKARIIDVVNLLECNNETFMLCSYGKTTRIMEWFDTYTFSEDLTATNVTDDYQSWLIAGPGAAEILALLSGLDSQALYSLPLFYHIECHIAGAPVLLTRQKSFSELSFIILSASESEDVINEHLKNTLPELDETTFELLRIEAGMPKSGAEWTELYNPLEAGLITAVSFTKGCYIGQEVIARLDSYNKVKFRLVGLSSEAEIPTGAIVYTENNEVGTVTSAVYAPLRNLYLALAYLRGAFINPGVSVEVRYNEITIQAEIHLLPFEGLQ